MTTSPILTATSSDIVTAALRLIGETDANQPVEADEIQDGLQALNYMIKAWQSQGLHLWTKTEGILFLDAGKTDYFIGPSGDECTTLDDFNQTAITTAVVAPSNNIAVSTTTGMTTSDTVGILLDDGTRQWTTIASIPDTTSFTTTDAISGDAAIGNSVFTYTSIIDRPVRVLQARRDNVTDTNNEIEAMQWSREEYFAQPDKTSQGTVNYWYYTPELTNGRMYVWQTASSANQVVKFTFERPIEVSNDVNNDAPDFPSEWFMTLYYNLAVIIGPEYKIPQSQLTIIKMQADEMLENSLGFDNEADAMDLQPYGAY